MLNEIKNLRSYFSDRDLEDMLFTFDEMSKEFVNGIYSREVAEGIHEFFKNNYSHYRFIESYTFRIKYALDVNDYRTWSLEVNDLLSNLRIESDEGVTPNA